MRGRRSPKRLPTSGRFDIPYASYERWVREHRFLGDNAALAFLARAQECEAGRRALRVRIRR